MYREYCVISHTHWDREWYLPFEQFRLRLVSLMDNLIELMEKEKKYIFHLDAQTVVLEDYLEIKPAMLERLKILISEGRLLVGPWYVQNDFNLVSGEATIRNLQIGIEIAEKFGECMMVGYAPDQFGLISQLPQILSKFGIDSCIFGRGKERYTDEVEGKPIKVYDTSEFYWDSENGSRILGIYLPFWYNNAQRFSEDLSKSLYFLNKIEEQLVKTSGTPFFLLMNGVDHLEAQENLLPILDSLNRDLLMGTVIRQNRLPDYIKKVWDHVGDKPLIQYIGEMRSGDDRNILQGTLSTRVGLKQMNFRCQRLLENYLEPLCTWLRMTGTGIFPQETILYAWKLLIKNHAHDSICGCSIDVVTSQMEERFKRVSEISEYLIGNSMETINLHIDRRSFQEDDQVLTFFNTTICDRNEVVEAEIDFKENHDINALMILDVGKNPVAFRILEKKKKKIRKFSPINLPCVIDVDSYKIRMYLEDIPGQGYRTYIVRPANKGDMTGNGLILDDENNVMENSYLRVHINETGLLNIIHKESGIEYSNLLLLEDREDIGDSYNYNKSNKGFTLLSSEFKPEIFLTEKDSFTTRYCLEYDLMVPASYDYIKDCRSRNMTLVKVKIYLQLDIGCPFLKVDIAIDNTAKDHRMRILFATGISTTMTYAGASFDIMVRDAGNVNAVVNKSAEQPFTGFVAVNGNKSGISFFAEGLYEYEKMNDADNTIAITLFRGNDSMYKPEGQSVPEDLFIIPGNQCLGVNSFKIAIYPYAGDIYTGDVLNKLQAFAIPILSCDSPANREISSIGSPFVQDAAISEVFVREDPYKNIALPLEKQFIKLKGRDISFSALKINEKQDSIILRLYNNSNESRNVEIEFSFSIREAFFTDLKEVRKNSIEIAGGSIKKIDLNPKEIITIEIVMDKGGYNL